MSESAPVVEAPQEVKAAPAEVSKASPAQDLRDIQALLVTGVFQGNMAPALVKAYQLLEMMASQVENESQKPS